MAPPSPQNSTRLLVLKKDDPRLSELLVQVRANKFSTDELGLLVIGKLNEPLPSEAMVLTVPAFVEGRPAAVQATLLQCGDADLAFSVANEVNLRGGRHER